MQEIVKEWGVGDDEMFASATLMRPFKTNKPVGGDITKADVLELQMKFKEDFRKMLA
jgi:hypothetical protein